MMSWGNREKKDLAMIKDVLKSEHVRGRRVQRGVKGFLMLRGVNAILLVVITNLKSSPSLSRKRNQILRRPVNLPKILTHFEA